MRRVLDKEKFGAPDVFWTDVFGDLPAERVGGRKGPTCRDPRDFSRSPKCGGPKATLRHGKYA